MTRESSGIAADLDVATVKAKVESLVSSIRKQLDQIDDAITILERPDE